LLPQVNYARPKDFGDATVDDVAEGKIFTSSAGFKAVGKASIGSTYPITVADVIDENIDHISFKCDLSKGYEKIEIYPMVAEGHTSYEYFNKETTNTYKDSWIASGGCLFPVMVDLEEKGYNVSNSKIIMKLNWDEVFGTVIINYYNFATSSIEIAVVDSADFLCTFTYNEETKIITLQFNYDYK